MAQNATTDDATDDEQPTRFEVVEEDCYGNHYEMDHKSRAIYGEAEEVAEVLTHTFSPGGVSGKARTVYEVVLKEEETAVVPSSVAEAASFFDLDVTAVESRYVNEATEQAALLLEPADTELYPRDA